MAGEITWLVSHCPFHLQSLGSRSRLFLALTAAVLLARTGRKIFRKRQEKLRRAAWNRVGKNVVVLHQFERGTNVPNLSPFALKVETFLRMHKIEYIVDEEECFSPDRHQCPWITINGEDISDSELIIRLLQQKFNIGSTLDRDRGLTMQEEAIGRALQCMLDHNTFAMVANQRYNIDRMQHALFWFSKKYRLILLLATWFFSKRIKAAYRTIGVGRNSEDENFSFLVEAMEAVDHILGDNRYLFGDAVSVFDATLFGHLTQLIFCCSPTIETYIRTHYDRLIAYQLRMRDEFWPDWQQCLSPP